MATYSATNISTGTVNIRKTASTTADTNGSVAKGATVSLTDYNQRWYSISGGYVVGDFFQLNTSGTGTKATSGFSGTVNVRYEPTDAAGSTSVVFTLGLNVSVTTISTSGSWTKITCSKGTGWIMTTYLGSSSGGDTNPGGTGVTMYVYNIPTNETVNLRKSASSSADVLVKVGYGKAVSNASASSTNGWHNASYGGYTGYIMSQYLTTDPNLGGGGSGGNTAEYLANVKQQITTYSNANRGKAGFITWDAYRAELEKYAAQGAIGYQASGSSKNPDGTYKSMCCASYPYICRGNGGTGASTQYNSYAATSTLKGKISDLGGLNNLVPGMEVFQGDATTKEHMGVYAGTYKFDNTIGYEAAVFQSTSARPNPSSIRVRYDDADRQGPNMTSMHSGWEYWIWPMYVVQ